VSASIIALPDPLFATGERTGVVATVEPMSDQFPGVAPVFRGFGTEEEMVAGVAEDWLYARGVHFTGRWRWLMVCCEVT
jgi:hypothetical protein